ncbi:MAG: HAD family hydrolase [Candidatus Cloacimonetes bacterium]|nr:HAD family hydrolase [Candidatus Cloacimonadota bacterium]
MDKSDIKIVFTDLDRTLLRDNNTLSWKNIQAIVDLKRRQIPLVIATGRNIFSARKVLPKDLPFDYLLFSSGCGIINWKTQDIIYQKELQSEEIIRVRDILLTYNIDFMIHHPIPDNHYFSFSNVNKGNEDFERRIAIYGSYGSILVDAPSTASQFIAILKPNQITIFNKIISEINFLNILRATSPLDHKSIWLEVLPKGVSKGHSAEWLCRKLGINQENTLSIGNDFNDLDLLEFTAKSCVVMNAPVELKNLYKVIASNEQNGFAKCVSEFI